MAPHQHARDTRGCLRGSSGPNTISGSDSSALWMVPSSRKMAKRDRERPVVGRGEPARQQHAEYKVG